MTSDARHAVEVVRLTPAEGVRLRTIRLAALRESPAAFGGTFAESEARPPEAWVRQLEDLATFVAVDDGTDVGMVRGFASNEVAGAAELISLWVAPQARGRGVGVALNQAIATWARTAGLAHVVLDVKLENRLAIELYARLGYTPVGTPREGEQRFTLRL